jgi:hypothetical protein
MEAIVARAMIIFYSIMVFANVQLIFKYHEVSVTEVLINLFGFMNAMLYLYLIFCCLTGKYVQIKRTLSVIVFTTILLYVPMTIREVQLVGNIEYVLLNSALLHVIIIGALVTRIFMIRRLMFLSMKRG